MQHGAVVNEGANRGIGGDMHPSPAGAEPDAQK